MESQKEKAGGALVIDSHLHVWSKVIQKPDASAPLPVVIGEGTASIEVLIREMDKAGVDGALIVQPSNYRWDHSYVLSATKSFPKRFRVMMLANPNLSPAQGTAYVKELATKGCAGVRFNPYLWPAGSRMDGPTGSAMFAEAGRRRLPVGFMTFKGLLPLLPQIKKLAATSPSTAIIIDHWGFPRADPAAKPHGQTFDMDAWKALLALAKTLPQVHVKVSALFRVSSRGGDYDDLQPYFVELLAAFGADRLLYGSDFPYVQLHSGDFARSLQAVRRWARAHGSVEEAEKIIGGTAARLFGF